MQSAMNGTANQNMTTMAIIAVGGHSRNRLTSKRVQVTLNSKDRRAPFGCIPSCKSGVNHILQARQIVTDRHTQSLLRSTWKEMRSPRTPASLIGHPLAHSGGADSSNTFATALTADTVRGLFVEPSRCLVEEGDWRSTAGCPAARVAAAAAAIKASASNSWAEEVDELDSQRGDLIPEICINTKGKRNFQDRIIFYALLE